MKIALNTVSHYDAQTVRLHWLTAGLVIALWCLGQSIDWFPHGVPRIFARSSHISAGVLLTIVLMYRIWWRLTGGTHLLAIGARVFDRLAKFMHLALYACLLGTVVLGLANVWVRGDTIFGLLRVPAFDAGNKALRANVEDFHAFAANLLLVLAGLHATAGLIHHFIMRDGILSRMLPTLDRR